MSVDPDRLPGIAEAVRAVPGVDHVAVRVTAAGAAAELEVTVAADADATRVSREVIEVLRTVGGVDPAILRIERATAPAAATRERPVFVALTIDRGELDVRVQVRLTLPGGEITGTATGLLAPDAEVRLAAIATADALTNAYSPAGRFEVLTVEPGSHPARVDVIVRTVTPGGQPLDLLGAALDPGDPRVAAVRAALDAVNRRLTPVARALTAA